jgi:crotonobetainyl-CoA:carnitine CoA-transferase CaiB-like acyl-CoA transferase
MMLADMGADVIKLEHPQHGDDTRHWGPPWLGEGEDRQSAYFLSVNRNKRSLTLDLKREQGRTIARQLAATSQVVIENFKVGQMQDYGLGYADLKAINPALVYCSITGFGQNGPYNAQPGYDYVVQAMSGLMSITGPAEGEAHKVGVAISDVIGGLNACNAILAALRHSEASSRGQHIDISLLDTQIAALVNIASNYLVSQENPLRMGNKHPNIVPYQTFQAADGAFVLAVGNDGQFAQLCMLLDRPAWQNDPHFSSNPARVANRDLLVRELAAIFLQKTRTEWLALLLEAGIPAGPINDVATALNDPQVLARDMIAESELSNRQMLRSVASPLKFSDTPVQYRYAPPALGQHSKEILRDILNFDNASLTELRDQGVI